MTNKEKIRSLSDEEMVRLFHRIANFDLSPCPLEDSDIDTGCCMDCDACFAKWLPSESEERVWKKLL